MTIEKKLASAVGTRSAKRSIASAIASPIVCAFDDLAKFAAHRLRRFAGDDAQTIAERQAGLDAADDDVDGVGKFSDEFLHAALRQKAQQPIRQPDAGDDARADSDRGLPN